MYFDSKKTIELCVKHRLTIEEVLIATLIYRDQFSEMLSYNEVASYSSTSFKNLSKKGYLQDLNIDGEYKPENYVVTDKFIQAVGVELDDLANMLWDAFPSWIDVGDKRFKGRNISPESAEELLNAKMLRGRLQPEDFNEVMISLESQKLNHTLGMALRSWIESEQWKLDDEDVVEHGEDL
jgi:hypothetical protein